MRLLHTSDWHLGRNFHRVSLLDAQRAFLDHLVKAAVEHRVDAVLVAGDVYDRAVPPLAAVRLFDHALHRLADAGVPVVMTSGNHDSAPRLGVGAGLLRRAGVHLCTDPADCGTPVLLADEHGPVAVYGLPYLEPSLTGETLGAERRSHTAVLTAAMDRVRADLAARTQGIRAVVLAHAFVTGGQGSDSERDISVGGVASVPAAVFDGVHYTALGHLHGCQTLSPRVRYSGSPLAYSFSEAGHRKSMWLIDLDGTGEITAERLRTPVPRPLARLRGTLVQLLEDGAHERHREAWVEVTLTDAVRPENPMARLAERFPHVLHLAFDPEGAAPGATGGYARRMRGRSELQIAEDFVAHVRGGREADPAEAHLLREAFDSVRTAETAGEGVK